MRRRSPRCKKSEFDPGSDARGNGEAGDAPALLDAEEMRKRQSGEVAEERGEENADDGEAQMAFGCRAERNSLMNRDAQASKPANPPWSPQEFPRHR